MRKVVDDMRLMIKVCDLYYNHNVSQQQIAGMLSLSRPTVSRLLSSAREKGIVQISVSNLGLIKYWEMERRLEEMYGLREVLIVDSSDDSDRQKDLLGKAAGRYLESTIKDGSVVGVSMGSTLYEVVAHINQPAAEDVTFVPLIGGMGQLRMDLHANNLAETLSYIYDGICSSSCTRQGVQHEDSGAVFEGRESRGGTSYVKESGYGDHRHRMSLCEFIYYGDWLFQGE